MTRLFRQVHPLTISSLCLNVTADVLPVAIAILFNGIQQPHLFSGSPHPLVAGSTTIVMMTGCTVANTRVGSAIAGAGGGTSAPSVATEQTVLPSVLVKSAGLGFRIPHSSTSKQFPNGNKQKPSKDN